jgi:flagellar protein FliO/FliZ
MSPTLRALPALSLLAVPAAAAAQAADAAAAPSFAGELLAIVVPLALVVAALLVLLKLARRRFRLTGQDAPLSVLQILPVGPRERLVLVKSRSGRVFAIGVGAQTVTFITNFDPEELAPTAAAAAQPSAEGLDTASTR